MKRAFAFLAVGVTAYVIFLLATLPAGHAYWLAHKQLPEVRLSALEGSVWSGSARQAQLGDLSLTDLHWAVRPAALFSGRLEVGFSSTDTVFTGDGRAGVDLAGTRYLRALRAQVPARVLTPMLRLPGLDLAGLLDIDLETVELSGDALTDLRGEVLWKDARVIGTVPVELGTLRFDANREGERLQIRVSDQQGPIGIQGTVSVERDGRYSFEGTFTPRGKADPQLVSALKLIGKTTATGTIEVRYAGVLQGM